MTVTSRRGAPQRRRAILVGLTLAAGVLPLPGAGSAAVGASPAASVVAQAGEVDARWAPWLGCWRLAGDDDADTRETVTDLTVCASPTARPDAVTLRTQMGTHPLFERQVVTDGTRHDVVDRDCRGSEVSDWSSSGLRLFTRAEVVCADRSARTVSVFATLTSDDEWLDIQVVAAGTGERIRIRRYQRVAVPTGPGGPPAARAEPTRVATPLSIDDVREATARLSPRAVEAALFETDASFDLTARRLIELDAAGVPAGIIDLMVALSFPQGFSIQRTAPTRTSAWTALADVLVLISPAAVDRYLPASVYPPFDYFAWGDEDAWSWSWGAGVIVVHPQPTGARGQVVDGLGYTQVSRHEAADAEGAPSGDSSSSSGDSSGSVSVEGYSKGSAEGDSGRTAQPRPPQ